MLQLTQVDMWKLFSQAYNQGVQAKQPGQVTEDKSCKSQRTIERLAFILYNREGCIFPMSVNALCYKEEEKASFEVMNKQHFCYEMCSNMSSLLNVNCQLMGCKLHLHNLYSENLSMNFQRNH